MKCEVVKDLIPLYDEQLCSEESAALIEEHIKTCAACNSLLKKLPKEELSEVDMDEIKPFVKIKRKFRIRTIALIVLCTALSAVLAAVGYLTVNQIFHPNGGVDFEDLIYKNEARQFAEMIAEGRMEEYVKRFDNLYIGDTDGGTHIGYRDYILQKLQTAYENVRKYNPSVGEVNSFYHNLGENDIEGLGGNRIPRSQCFYLEFTRSDGTVLPIRISTAPKDENNNFHIQPALVIPEAYMDVFTDPEKSYHEQYAGVLQSDIPDDLREICAFINTLSLAEKDDLNIEIITNLMRIAGGETPEKSAVENVAYLVAVRFAKSDYNAVFKGICSFAEAGYSLDTAVGADRFDAERNMFYYPVMLTASDGGQEIIASVKIYFDEYGCHSPRKEDIKGITGDTDLEIRLAEIFG